MPGILYGTGAYRRDNGNLPELRLVNMFIESATTSDQGVALLSRQGLKTDKTLALGPVTGVFSENNVFGGDIFSVSGGRLYRGTTDLGSMTVNGPVSFAAGTSTELLIATGGPLYRYDGATLTAVSFPDGADVTCVVFHDGLYIAARAGTDKWYWSDVLDGATWDALNFASAEYHPDVLLDIKITSDFVMLFGGDSIERWVNTGDPDLPYSRIEASIIRRGALKTGVVVGFNNTLVFVGDDGIVYQIDQGLKRVSDNGIEERIASSSSASAFGFTYFGHQFYCLRLDSHTYLFDLLTEQWCEFASYGQTNWKAGCACMVGQTAYFGDATSGKVLKFSGWDDDGTALERLFTAFFPIDGSVVPVNNLLIEVNTGWTAFLAGQGSNPTVEMRSSINAGATWNSWRSSTIGSQGHYRARSRWTRCGTFDFPGGMFEIRCTDPISLRVSKVLVNEQSGGRGRGI